MGNASEELKSEAKWITGTNDENGVGMAIDRFILNKVPSDSEAV
jgi:hydroxymethylpyrimidine pyrophosphatase-like HAD family hydrolase